MLDRLPLDRRPAAAASVGVAVVVGAVFASLRVLAYSWLEPLGGLLLFAPAVLAVSAALYATLRHRLFLPTLLAAGFFAVAMRPTADEGLGNPVAGEVFLTAVLLQAVLLAALVEALARRGLRTVRRRWGP